MNEEKEIMEQAEPVAEKPKRQRRKPKAEQEPATVEDAKATLLEKPVTASKPVDEPNMKPYRAKVVCGLLNVRERPEKASSVIRVAKHNEEFLIVDHCENEWCKLAENGGYVMREFIERVD